MKKMLVLVVLFVLASCASPVDEVEVPDPDNPFVGTWEQRGTNPNGEYYNILKFTNTHFSYKATSSGNEFSGPYTYTETTITFDPDEGIDEEDKDIVPWTTNYLINDNRSAVWFETKMTIRGTTYVIGGTYTKE